MRRILMNDIHGDLEAFDVFPRTKKSLLGMLRAWFWTTTRVKQPAEKPALGF